MIESLIIYIQSVVAEYGARGVFIATLIEEIIAPIPSPLVPLAAGFLMLRPDLSLDVALLTAAFSIALPVGLGISLGSALVYAIGYGGGKPLIEKNQKFLGIRWQDVERVEARLLKSSRDEAALLLLRLIPIIPGVAVSGVCGIIRFPFYRFIGITLVGAFVRALILGLIGWQVGELYTLYADIITRAEKYIFLAFLVSIGVLGIGYYITKRVKSLS